MIEAWHRADEWDVCEWMAIADTAVSAGLKEATQRLLRPCPRCKHLSAAIGRVNGA
jgi:hypothetical protein